MKFDKSILERAENHQGYCSWNGSDDYDYISYAIGATEQLEIDIQRACEFLQNEVPIQEHFRYPKEWYIEQLKQTMKGE